MNEETIFHHARQRSDPERATFLEHACEGDADLRRRVDALLDAHDVGEGFLDQLPVGLATAADEQLRGSGRLPRRGLDDGGSPAEGAWRAAAAEGTGSRIGPYTLREQIGEGGMGTVFLAEQTDPVRRTVALKIIKPGMDSRQVIARFEAERQALALMDHPNIARVIDAGTTDAGRPFFVMDLVRGEPITTYCDRQHLTPRQRVGLFLPVCQAVQHAHQKGVIHRDIKPSNVLVALFDGVPVPKVIDFGVAKAAGPTLADRTRYTEFGSVIGTVEYMSPEQAGLNQLDVDTRSDIYSLGVLLYELLTGTTPLEPARVKTAALLEVLRLVREEEVPRPSTRLSSAESLPSIAASRGLEPKKLSGVVRGELDWIVLKALEKDRARRYETANGLARDLERYLNDEPVQAGPASASYRMRKFARRHKGPVLAAMLVALTLLGGFGATAWQAVRANRLAVRANRLAIRADGERAVAVAERNEKRAALEAEQAARGQAMATLRSLTDDVVGWQVARQPNGGSAEILLERIVAHYEEFASLAGDTPEARFIRAEGSLRVGFLRERTKDRNEARAAYERAIALFQQLADDFPAAPDYRRYVALTEVALGNVLRDSGKAAEADAATRRAAAIRARIPDGAGPGLGGKPDYRRYLAGDHDSLRRLLLTSRRRADAEVEQRQALTLREQLVADFPDEVDDVVELGANCYRIAALVWQRGDLQEAAGWCARGIETLSPVVKRNVGGVAARWYLCQMHSYQAQLLEKLARFGEAVNDWERAISLDKWQWRDEYLYRRAMCLARVDPAKASAAAGELIASDPDHLERILRFAPILVEAGDGEGFRRLRDRALARGEEMKCFGQPGRKSYLLARLCLLSPDVDDDPAKAIWLAEQAQQAQPNCAWYLHTLSLAYYRARRYSEAVERLDQSVKAEPGWAGQPLNSLVLAMAHQRLNHPDEARRWLQKAIRSQDTDTSAPWAPTPMGMHTHDWPVWLSLRREAEALIPAADK